GALAVAAARTLIAAGGRRLAVVITRLGFAVAALLAVVVAGRGALRLAVAVVGLTVVLPAVGRRTLVVAALVRVGGALLGLGFGVAGVVVVAGRGPLVVAIPGLAATARVGGRRRRLL